MANELLRILDLLPAGAPQRGGDTGSHGSADVFTGHSLPYPAHRVFGGQILAQSVIAAGQTVEPAAAIHSLHGYFLLRGDPATPILFRVQRLRDGRSFFARRIDATQDGRLIATMMTSFQLPATGPEHQDAPPRLPPPETLAPRRPFASAPEPHGGGAPVLPFELRPIPLGPAPGVERRATATWLRVTADVPDQPLLHAALLALLSDFSLLWPAVTAHGFGTDRSRVKTASIDHSMWFHRPCRADRWILYDVRSPSAGGARASGIGRMFTSAGELVASSAQEGMFRVVG